jgi:ribosomal protein S18 acetylase RimI-like enzyme
VADSEHVGSASGSGGGRPSPGITLRPAVATDATRVAALVDAAYGGYVARIGMRPGPMTEDHAEVIASRKVTVAEVGGAIVGLLVLAVDDEGFLIENVAVHPSHQGRGLGRTLLETAETAARNEGFGAIHLSTHELMTENLALYARIGYEEYDRRSEGGFSRVFLRKHVR